MSYVVETMTNLAAQTGFAFLKPGNFIMILVALVFLYLAIAKGYEPLLLVPISFGMSSPFTDFLRRWSTNRLRSADCQSSKFLAGGCGAVWYLQRVFPCNAYGI